MKVEALELALREGLAVVIAALSPVLVTVAVVGVIVGLASARLGLRDPAVAQIARALAVCACLGLAAEPLATLAVDYARASWSSLGRVDTAETP